jgi:hypothetical protein
MELKDIVTVSISIAALLLASYSLYLQRKDKRPKLKVELSYQHRELPIVSDGGGGFLNAQAPVYVVEVRNHGERDIRLSSAELIAGKRDRVALQPFSGTFGKVEPNAGQTFIFIAAQVKIQVKNGTKQKVQMIDALRNRYTSNSIKLNQR